MVHLKAAIHQVIEDNVMFKAAMHLHPLQIPRAGVSGRKAKQLCKSVNEMENIFRDVFADETT